MGLLPVSEFRPAFKGGFGGTVDSHPRRIKYGVDRADVHNASFRGNNEWPERLGDRQHSSKVHIEHIFCILDVDVQGGANIVDARIVDEVIERATRVGLDIFDGFGDVG